MVNETVMHRMPNPTRDYFRKKGLGRKGLKNPHRYDLIHCGQNVEKSEKSGVWYEPILQTRYLQPRNLRSPYDGG